MWYDFRAIFELCIAFIVTTLGGIANRKTPAFCDGDGIVITLAICDVANRVANHKTRHKSLFIVTNHLAQRIVSQITPL